MTLAFLGVGAVIGAAGSGTYSAWLRASSSKTGTAFAKEFFTLMKEGLVQLFKKGSIEGLKAWLITFTQSSLLSLASKGISAAASVIGTFFYNMYKKWRSDDE